MKFYYALYDIPVPGDGFKVGSLKNKARGEFSITAVDEDDALIGLRAALRQAFGQDVAVEVLKFEERVELLDFAWTQAAKDQTQTVIPVNPEGA